MLKEVETCSCVNTL